jgi:hypothetical protein
LFEPSRRRVFCAFRFVGLFRHRRLDLSSERGHAQA